MTKTRYNPAQDSFCISLQLHENDLGDPMDIDTEIYHSEKHGFYRKEHKAQRFLDRCWENVSEADQDTFDAGVPSRVLRTPCSPLTKGEVIRMIVSRMVPEEGGARRTAMAAIHAAGIP